MTQQFQKYFKQMRHSAHLLMCPPTYYQLVPPHPQYGHPNDMSAAAYDAFTQNTDHFKKTAEYQWEQLFNTIQNLGINTTLLQPDAKLSDQVFTADASLSFSDQDKSFVLASKFSHWGRQDETKYHLDSIQVVYPNRPYIQGVFASEGAGDNLYDVFRDVFFSGFSSQLQSKRISAGRSDKRAHNTLNCVSGRPVISLELERPFFHIDTSLMPLSMGHLLVYPGGLKEESYLKLLKFAFADFNLPLEDYLIEVTAEEAIEYACNSINIGDLVIMSKTSNRLSRLLENLGYQVEMVDLSGFIAAGGGPHCLTNNIGLKRIPGGLIKAFQCKLT